MSTNHFLKELNLAVELDEIQRELNNSIILEQDDSEIRQKLKNLEADLRGMANQLDSPEELISFIFAGELPEEDELTESVITSYLTEERGQYEVKWAKADEKNWAGGKSPGEAFEEDELMGPERQELNKYLVKILSQFGTKNAEKYAHNYLGERTHWPDINLVLIKPSKHHPRLLLVRSDDKRWATMRDDIGKEDFLEKRPFISEQLKQLHKDYITISLSGDKRSINDAKKLYLLLTGRDKLKSDKRQKTTANYVDKLVQDRGPQKTLGKLVGHYRLLQSKLAESAEIILSSILLEQIDQPRDMKSLRAAFSYFIDEYPQIWNAWKDEELKDEIITTLKLQTETGEQAVQISLKDSAPEAAKALEDAGIDPPTIPDSYKKNKASLGATELVKSLGSMVKNLFTRTGRKLLLGSVIKILGNKEQQARFKQYNEQEAQQDREYVKNLFHTIVGQRIDAMRDKVVSAVSKMGGVTAERPSIYAILITPPGENGQKKIVYVTKRLDGKHELGLPGGGVEEGESGVETIRREVKEEIGIDITKIRPMGIFGPERNVVAFQLDKHPKFRLTPEARKENIVQVGAGSLNGLLGSRAPKMIKAHQTALKDFWNKIKDQQREAKRKTEKAVDEREKEQEEVEERPAKKQEPRRRSLRRGRTRARRVTVEPGEWRKAALPESIIRQIAATLNEDSEFTLQDLEALKKGLVEEWKPIGVRLISRLTMPGKAEYKPNQLVLSNIKVEINDPTQLLQKLESIAAGDQDVVLDARQNIDKYPEYYALLAIQPEMERRMLDSGYEYKGVSKDGKENAAILLSPMSEQEYSDLRQEMPLDAMEEPEADLFAATKDTEEELPPLEGGAEEDGTEEEELPPLEEPEGEEESERSQSSILEPDEDLGI